MPKIKVNDKTSGQMCFEAVILREKRLILIFYNLS